MLGTRKIKNNKLVEINGGEPVTLTAVMAILAIAIVTIVCFRLFRSEKGSVKLPGGFQFSWE